MWLPTWAAYSLDFSFFLWLIGSCDNVGLATCSALCLCDEHVHCETWEVMSEADTQTLRWRAEIVQLYDGCLHFLCTNGGQPFVNTSAGKGWVELCLCIDGVRGGKQKLILAHYANPVDAKEQFVFLTVEGQTHYLPYYSNVKNRHTALWVCWLSWLNVSWSMVWSNERKICKLQCIVLWGCSQRCLFSCRVAEFGCSSLDLLLTPCRSIQTIQIFSALTWNKFCCLIFWQHCSTTLCHDKSVFNSCLSNSLQYVVKLWRLITIIVIQ